MQGTLKPVPDAEAPADDHGSNVGTKRGRRLPCPRGVHIVEPSVSTPKRKPSQSGLDRPFRKPVGEAGRADREHGAPRVRLSVVGRLAGSLALMMALSGCGPDPATKASSARSGGSAEDSLLAPGDQVVDARKAPAPRAASGRWSVLLATFSGEGHAARAAEFRDEVARRYPVFGGAFVEPRRGGSIVVVGRYASADDPAAQEALSLAKGIAAGGSRPFAAAMLVRRTTAADAAPPKPHDLRSLRARSPGRTELYTLQIGIWSTFGTKEISPAEVMRRAELEVAKLRAQGYEAWFHHDPDSEMSTITVGSFGSDAYDPRSTLYAPEVERLMRAFPKHLVNGEEVLVPADLRRGSGSLRPQGPRLVEVPFD